MKTISQNEVFVNFQCSWAKCLKETIYKTSVSDLIITGPPICPDCGEECSSDGNAEVEY